MTDYRDVNLSHWNERAAAHAASPGYPVASLVSDPAALSEVVAFDRPLLGALDGQRGIHLQCHIGTDTVSLSRLGATMTGLDFLTNPFLRLETSRRSPAPMFAFFKPTCTTPARSPAMATTSSTPEWARSAGCRTSRAGPAWSPRS